MKPVPEPPHLLKYIYERDYAPEFDALKRDDTMRKDRDKAPLRAWFYNRAKKKGWIVAVRYMNDDVVITRVK